MLSPFFAAAACHTPLLLYAMPFFADYYVTPCAIDIAAIVLRFFIFSMSRFQPFSSLTFIFARHYAMPLHFRYALIRYAAMLFFY